MDTLLMVIELETLKKKMDNAEAFLEELIHYIFVVCKDDDYITPEGICRKLYKYGFIDKKDGYYLVADGIKADRKTENSSEKPNNCEYAENPSGDVWECGCFLDTYCEHQIYDRNPDGTINIVEFGYEPKDEPVDWKDQMYTEAVETMSCQECKWYREDLPCRPYIVGLECKYEPKTEQTEREGE